MYFVMNHAPGAGLIIRVVVDLRSSAVPLSYGHPSPIDMHKISIGFQLSWVYEQVAVTLTDNAVCVCWLFGAHKHTDYH